MRTRTILLVVGSALLVWLIGGLYCHIMTQRCEATFTDPRYTQPFHSDALSEEEKMLDCKCSDFKNNRNSYWPSYWLSLIQTGGVVRLTYGKNCHIEGPPILWVDL